MSKSKTEIKIADLTQSGLNQLILENDQAHDRIVQLEQKLVDKEKQMQETIDDQKEAIEHLKEAVQYDLVEELR